MTPPAELLLPAPSLTVLRIAGVTVDGPCQVAEECQVLSAGQTAALVDRANADDVPLRVAIGAAWALVLSAYARERLVWFALREAPGHAVVRGVEISDDIPVWEWIHTVRHQVSLPEPPTDTALDGGRPPDWTAQTDTLLSIGTGLFGVSVAREGALTVDCQPGAQLTIRACYDRRCYAADDISIVVEQFRAALTGLAECGAQPPRDLRLFGCRDHTLIESAQPRPRYPTQHTVVSLFRAQADATPDVVACLSDDHEITYAELDDKVRGLARTIKELTG